MKVKNIYKVKENRIDKNLKINLSSKPYLNFKFLHKTKIGDFQTLSKLEKKNHAKYFEELQRFIYDFDNENKFDEAIRHYTSRKGSKIGKENSYVKQVITSFEKNHKEYAQFFVLNELIHIHTKKQGKGSFVLFGIEYYNTFYVLAMNPNHDF